MKIIIFLSFIICSFTYAQNVTVKIVGSIATADLYKLEGEQKSILRNLKSQNGEFTFSLRNEPFGFYRFEFDKNHWFDFLHNGDNSNFQSEYNDLIDSLRIFESTSNSLLYEFRKLNSSFKTKTELLNFILLRYPKDDNFYQITQKTLDLLQNEYTNFVFKISSDYSNSFVSRYVKTSQLPVVPSSISIQNRLDYLKSHALDYVDFNDAELIYSDAFTNKTIEYLTYFRNPQLPKGLLEKEFIIAVDTLLNKAKVNQLVYQHIAGYLIDGFKQYGFDEVIDYMIENYVIEDDICLDEETENSIQKRIDQSKLLGVGKKVPNILMPDINGEIIDLFTIQSNNILLVFYSSQCPHCETLLPRLSEFQKRENELNIIAISLDNKREEWIEFVRRYKFDFININEPNGWDGKLTTNYFIYATPTMFLLDEEKKIISKPTRYEELLKFL